MKTFFAPGCALLLYKPELASKILETLIKMKLCEGIYEKCCHNMPDTDEEILIINTCPGCDRRYSALYKNISTLSLWEILAKSDSFTFPDHRGVTVSIHDACPTRKKAPVHKAIRQLLKKMHITVTEAQRTKTSSVCCGDTYYGKLSASDVESKMKERAAEMPSENVVVYCVSCVKSMSIGGRKPLYLPDLLFADETFDNGQTLEEWHNSINEFIKTH